MKGVLNRKLLLALIALLVVALSCALLVSCKTVVYSVTAEFTVGGGTVEVKDADGNAATQFEVGTAATVIVKPNEGFEVTAFKVNGVDVTLSNGVYTHTVTGDTLISVTFTQKSVPSPQPTALAAPVIKNNGNVVTWSAVEHATGYEVYIGSVKKADVTACTYTFAETAEGTYNLTVKAVSTDSAYTTSAASNALEFIIATRATTILAAPVISKEGNVVSWAAVEHATGYEVYFGSTKKADVTACTYTFAETTVGDYSLTVKAVSTDANYTTSAASNALQFNVSASINTLAEALTSVKTTFRAAGEAIYTETGATAQLFNIVTVFGANSKSTVESKLTGEVQFEQAIVNRDGKAALPYHTKTNTIDYKVSQVNYADYDNPFKTLTAADFQTTDDVNVFKLTDAAKAKVAARNITGWDETIATFTVTVADGKIAAINIETAEMTVTGTDVKKTSVYAFEVTLHGAAAVDAKYTSPYAKTADHDRLAAALTKAKAAQNYTWRVHEEEQGYEDLDYNIFVTDGMIYIDCLNWEEGYWWKDETLYPFDYTPAKDNAPALITMWDPLEDRSFATVRAIFTDSAFLAEMFECVNGNTFVLRDEDYAGDYAFYFADGRDNQKLYLSCAVDLTITLNANGDLDTVEFYYDVFGSAFVKRVLTFTGVGTTAINIDTTNIEYSSMLDDYLGEYLSFDKAHRVVVTEDGITVDGEEFVVEEYSAVDQMFVGTINGETFYILNMFQKQLVVFNDAEQEADQVQYVVTNTVIETVTIPEKYWGVWAAKDESDQYTVAFELVQNVVAIGDTELIVLSYDEENEVIAYNPQNGITYAFWMEVDGLPSGKLLVVAFENGVRKLQAQLSRLYDVSADGVNVPESVLGEMESVQDGGVYNVKVTEQYIALTFQMGEETHGAAFVITGSQTVEGDKQMILLLSNTLGEMAIIINGDNTFDLCQGDGEGNYQPFMSFVKVDPNAPTIPSVMHGAFSGKTADDMQIDVVIGAHSVVLAFDGVKKDVTVKSVGEGSSFGGTYCIVTITVDGVDYELAEYTDKAITIETEAWRVPVELTKVTSTEPDPGPGPSGDKIPGHLVGIFRGTNEKVEYVVEITNNDVLVFIDGNGQAITKITVDDIGIEIVIDGQTFSIGGDGSTDAPVAFITLYREDPMLFIKLARDSNEPSQGKLPSKYNGTYQGTAENDAKYEVIIDGDNVIIIVNGGEKTVGTVTEYTVETDAYEMIELSVGEETPYTACIMTYDNEEINNISFMVGNEISVDLTRVSGGDDPTPGFIVPDKFLGEYEGTKNEVTYHVTVDKNGIVVFAGQDKMVSTSISGDEAELTVTFESDTWSFTMQDENTLFICNGDYSFMVSLPRVSGGDDPTPSVIIPDEFFGLFKGTSAETHIRYEVTINEKTVTLVVINGDDISTLGCSASKLEEGSHGDQNLTVTDGKQEYVIQNYYGALSLSSDIEKQGLSLIKYADEPVIIATELQGRFSGQNSAGETYALEVTEDNAILSVTDSNGQVTNVDVVVVSIDESWGVTLYLAVNDVECTFLYDDYDKVYVLASVYDNGNEINVQLSKTTESVVIPEAFRGELVGEDTTSGITYELSISDTAITFTTEKGGERSSVEGVATKVEETAYTTDLKFTVDGQQYTIQYAFGSYTLLNDGGLEVALHTPSSGPVEIPASFIGVFTGANEKNTEETYTFTIEAEAVSVVVVGADKNESVLTAEIVRFQSDNYGGMLVISIESIEYSITLDTNNTDIYVMPMDAGTIQGTFKKVVE